MHRRPRREVANPQFSSASASRRAAASLGCRARRRSASSRPASPTRRARSRRRCVWPVLTPSTHGTRPTSPLRLVTARTWSPVRSTRVRWSPSREERLGAGAAIGQLDEVAGARVVARLVEPDRCRVVRVRQARARAPGRSSAPTNRLTEPPTLKARSSAASSALGSSIARSRSRTLIRSPGAQADLRVLRGRVVAAAVKISVELRVVERDQRGHQLRRAGDRDLGGRVAAVKLIAGAFLDQRPARTASDGEATARAGPAPTPRSSRRSRERNHKPSRERGRPPDHDGLIAAAGAAAAAAGRSG